LDAGGDDESEIDAWMMMCCCCKMLNQNISRQIVTADVDKLITK
jgi:hypothetical protein